MEQVEELADAVIGRKQGPLQGGGRDHESGLVYQVEELNKHLVEGVRVRVPTGVWVAIVTSVGAIMVQVISTLAS